MALLELSITWLLLPKYRLYEAQFSDSAKIPNNG